MIGDEFVFDYHGYTKWERYWAHTRSKAQRWWPGWDADFVRLPLDVLVSEARSKEYEGLWLREPRQFLHDALLRARRYLSRFPDPEVWCMSNANLPMGVLPSTEP